jgi:hypothetical protein
MILFWIAFAIAKWIAFAIATPFLAVHGRGQKKEIAIIGVHVLYGFSIKQKNN